MGSEYLPKLLLQSSNTQQSDFDGHGGSEASSYVKDQVMKLFFHHNSLACNFLSNYQLILLHGFTNVVPSNPVLHQWIEVGVKNCCLEKCLDDVENTKCVMCRPERLNFTNGPYGLE